MNMFKKLLLLDESGEKGLRSAVTACVLTSFSLMIPFVITVQVFLELIKPLTGREIEWNHMWILFGIGLAAFVVIFLLSKNDYQKTYGSSYGQAEATRLRVAEQMRKMPMSYFNARDLTELSANIMTDCTNIEQSMSSAVPQLIANIITSTVICIMMAFLDWRMALAVFIMLPISVLILWLSRALQDRMFSQHVEAKLEAEKQSQEYMEGIKVIRACGLGGSKFKALDQAFLELKKAAFQVELVSGSFTALATMLLRSGVGIVVFTGVSLLTSGKIEFISMLMFLLIVIRIYGPILTVLTLLPDMLYLKVSSSRLRTMMEAKPMEGHSEQSIKQFDIAFENVTFGYGEKAVIKNVSFTAPEGKVTALVGPSGSGKSTIARLAARFWDAEQGTVCIGGIDVKEMNPEYLMHYFSFVFQEVTLFNDTVEANIRIGKTDASMEEIYAAAKAAYCDEFIHHMTDGYQTILGENGATLSGGERQRISIARALLKNAPIVILDEATASLDPENEVSVQHAIGRLIEGKTVLVIAHRLRTIIRADKIIVLNNGKLIEEGTSDKLLEEKGLFSQLYQIQKESFDWEMGSH